MNPTFFPYWDRCSITNGPSTSLWYQLLSTPKIHMMDSDQGWQCWKCASLWNRYLYELYVMLTGPMTSTWYNSISHLRLEGKRNILITLDTMDSISQNNSRDLLSYLQITITSIFCSTLSFKKWTKTIIFLSCLWYAIFLWFIYLFDFI